MELNLLQLTVLGLVASALAQGYKLLFAKFGKDVSGKVATGVVALLSIGFSYFWLQPTLPVLTDNPILFVSEIIALAGTVLGFATAIYNWLLVKVFEKLDLVKTRYIKSGPPS